MHNHSTGTRDGNGNSSPQTAKQHRCTDAMNIYQARGGEEEQGGGSQDGKGRCRCCARGVGGFSIEQYVYLIIALLLRGTACLHTAYCRRMAYIGHPRRLTTLS